MSVNHRPNGETRRSRQSSNVSMREKGTHCHKGGYGGLEKGDEQQPEPWRELGHVLQTHTSFFVKQLPLVSEAASFGAFQFREATWRY